MRSSKIATVVVLTSLGLAAAAYAQYVSGNCCGTLGPGTCGKDCTADGEGSYKIDGVTHKECVGAKEMYDNGKRCTPEAPPGTTLCGTRIDYSLPDCVEETGRTEQTVPGCTAGANNCGIGV